MPDDEHPLILFDGVCNLCTGAVQFVIKRDRKARFRFASLQSAVGERLVKQHGTTGPGVYSILLIKGHRFYDRSSAVLEILRDLSGLWPALYVLKIIPSFIRDAVYRLIATNRYRVFGKKEQCMVPTPELKARFVE